MTNTSTKDKILDAAEQLYAQKGFNGTSLRAIMKLADVNIAAVHYHFGSKESLIEAVLQRRAEPINTARIAALDDLESRHSGRDRLPVEGIVRAFIEPVIRTYLKPTGGEVMASLMGRFVMEAGRDMKGCMTRIFGHVSSRFVTAISQAMPELSPNDVFWRMHFMIGAMAFTITVPHAHKHEDVLRFAQDGDIEVVLDELVQFVTAGMVTTPAHPRKDAS